MPVNLKLIPAPAVRPRPPVRWVWLLLLVVMLLGGTAKTILSTISRTESHSEAFWASALGLPALFWLILLALRITWYNGQLAIAQRRDNDRERRLRHDIQRGQRYLNVLGMSLYSALREPEDADGTQQWNAVQGKVKGIKTQPSWKGHEGVRHSRLPLVNSESAEQMLSRALKSTLEELSIVLSSLPHETPLALLLERHSSLPENLVEEIWQDNWAASQIRQTVTRMEGGGLTTVDKWLDDSNNARSLLMIIAIQVRPEQTEGSAECIVGLLLGNKSISPEVVPLARLHRPEMMHHTSNDDFQYALQQSLGWVPITADAVKSGFLVGVNPAWHMTIATGLQAIHSPINAGQDLYDVGHLLGYPGPAAPWVAITCAVRACQCSASQLIVSGDDGNSTPLWVTMVTLAAPPQQ
ncbi:hypothetical protein ACGVWS_15810 [Enterobacteriaceae bacterium LUAb1]